MAPILHAPYSDVVFIEAYVSNTDHSESRTAEK